MYANRISTQRTATLMETRKGAYLPAFAVLCAAYDKKKQQKEQHPISFSVSLHCWLSVGGNAKLSRE